MEKRRGDCRVCDREYRIRADGMVNAHRVRAPGLPFAGDLCEGSGQPPANGRTWPAPEV